MRKLALALCLLVAAPALADRTKNRATRPTTRITAQTLAASRSFEIENSLRPGSEGTTWGLLNIWVTITDANNSETGVSLTCTGSTDNNTTDFLIPTCTWDNTNTRWNCEPRAMFWNPSDDTTSKRMLFRVDVEGIEDLECTFSFVGGASADTIDVSTTWAIKG